MEIKDLKLGGRFEKIKKLGAGAFGEAYLGKYISPLFDIYHKTFY